MKVGEMAPSDFIDFGSMSNYGSLPGGHVLCTVAASALSSLVAIVYRARTGEG